MNLHFSKTIDKITKKQALTDFIHPVLELPSGIFSAGPEG